MGKLFDMDAPVMRFLARTGELMILSALWLVCSLGVVTLGAATAALQRAVFNMRADMPCGPVVFFRAFRDNFLKATVAWLLVMAAAAVLFGAFWLMLLVENEIVRFVCLVVFCLLFFLAVIFTVYVFPLTAYFENSIPATLKNAFFMGIGNLKKTVPACALTLLPWVAFLLMGELWFGLLVFWMFLAPGAIAYGVTGLLTGVFAQYAKEDSHGVSADQGE